MSTLQTKNYIQVQVKSTPLHVIGSVASNGSNVGNVMFPPMYGLTLPQARAYADAMVKAAQFVAKRIGAAARRGNPGKKVETSDLRNTRLLFFNDDQYFVRWERQRLDYGLYTFPVVSMPGLTRDVFSTMQAVASLYAAIDEAVTAQKISGAAARKAAREE